MAEAALFTELDDDRFQATERSRGPWSVDALHGGPVAALVVRTAERELGATGSDGVTPVRLTIDLERPVPLTPLLVRADIVRPGRKVQVAEVTVHDDGGRRLVRATVLAIRREDLPLPADRPRPHDPQPPPVDAPVEEGMWEPMGGDVVAYHKDGVEHRFVRGGFMRLGPTTDWIRLTVPVVAGETPSGFQRAVAAADFVNGISGTLPFDEWTFINPDLTVTLHRIPEGEWVALDAVTRLDPSGVGTAEADLFDEHGRIGRCVQTLIVQHR